jgi:polyhydroxyalkanoate synthesis regulator phasin
MEISMKELLEKAKLFGLGVFDFTREKVESVVDEMVRRGEISQQESPEAVKELLARAQEAQAATWDKVKELINQALAEMKPARAADLEALEKRVAALEDEVRQLKGA